MKYILLFILLSTTYFGAIGQLVEAAWESNIALKYEALGVQASTAIRQRHEWREYESGNTSAQLIFVEANQVFSKPINAKMNASLAYRFRLFDTQLEANRTENRVTQQLAIQHQSDKVGLSSRVRAEQRFFTDEFAHRYRYHFGVELPLKGSSVDAKEFYLKVSNEVLVEFSKNIGRLDDRISCGGGFVASDKLTFEFEMIYRIEGINNSIETVPFFHTNVVLGI